MPVKGIGLRLGVTCDRSHSIPNRNVVQFKGRRDTGINRVDSDSGYGDFQEMDFENLA